MRKLGNYTDEEPAVDVDDVEIQVEETPSRMESTTMKFDDVATKTKELKITAPVALVRKSPSESAQIVLFAKRGSTYQAAAETAPNWTSILLPQGKIGWVISENVSSIH